jgi:hypothetical protein
MTPRFWFPPLTVAFGAPSGHLIPPWATEILGRPAHNRAPLLTCNAGRTGSLQRLMGYPAIFQNGDRVLCLCVIPAIGYRCVSHHLIPLGYWVGPATHHKQNSGALPCDAVLISLSCVAARSPSIGPASIEYGAICRWSCGQCLGWGACGSYWPSLPMSILRVHLVDLIGDS